MSGPAIQAPESTETVVILEGVQGLSLRGTLLRLANNGAVFEVFHPSVVFEVTQVIPKVRIHTSGRMPYSGPAVVRDVIHTGLSQICEVDLSERWLEVFPHGPNRSVDHWQAEFGEFMGQREAYRRISADYKAVIADLQSYLTDLRNWLEPVELWLKSVPSESQVELRRTLVRSLAPAAIEAIDSMVWRFEAIVDALPVDSRGVYREFLRRHLHPLILVSPFAQRAYYKPLGYAGDYEMVNMILRDPCEGPSLFAQVVNFWLLGQMPAEAHRNRIKLLDEKLAGEVLRARRAGRPLRAYSLGCGPAIEVQRFLAQETPHGEAEFTLVDFNDETLERLRSTLITLQQDRRTKSSANLVKKSVRQIIKESLASSDRVEPAPYDFVYCSGLFDYFTDEACRRITEILYASVKPGGLLLLTNVDATLNDARSFHHSLEFMLDWNLVYRTAAQLRSLVPSSVKPEDCRVTSDHTGVNCFLEVRKPRHA